MNKIKKIIMLFLSIITIFIGGYVIVNFIPKLDIAANKMDQYVASEIWKISERTDISNCEKELLCRELEWDRKYDRQRAKMVGEIQEVMLLIVLLQVILLIVLLTIKSRPNKEKK